MFLPILNVSSHFGPLPVQTDLSRFPTLTVLFMMLGCAHYVLVLCSMRKFVRTSSFYLVFVVSGVFDVMHCVSIVWIWVAKECFYGPDYFVVTNCLKILDYVFFCSNSLCNLLMCLNRFSGTFLWYTKFWTTRNTLIYLSIVLFLSILESCPYATYEWVYYVEEGKWRVVSTYDLQVFVKVMDATLIVVTETLGIVLIAMTYFRLKSGQRKMSNLEMNLIFVSALHFSLDFCILIAELDLIFRLDHEITLFLKRNIFRFIFILTICNSVCVIFTNKTVRKEYFAIFRRIVGRKKVTSGVYFVTGLH